MLKRSHFWCASVISNVFLLKVRSSLRAKKLGLLGEDMMGDEKSGCSRYFLFASCRRSL